MQCFQGPNPLRKKACANFLKAPNRCAKKRAQKNNKSEKSLGKICAKKINQVLKSLRKKLECAKKKLTVGNSSGVIARGTRISAGHRSWNGYVLWGAVFPFIFHLSPGSPISGQDNFLGGVRSLRGETPPRRRNLFHFFS